MKIIEQSHEILRMTPSPLELIESAGRVCYKSEDKICPGSAGPFVSKVSQVYKHESIIEHAVATVRFITDRGVTHELIRHRLASYSQESTRYVNYSHEKFGGELTFIRPVLFSPTCHAYAVWKDAMQASEDYYFELLRATDSPQWARQVLPCSVKTEIVMTANFREWKHVFNLRCKDSAHPQIHLLLKPLQDQFINLYPEIFA